MIVIDDFLPDLAIAKRFIAGVEYGSHEFMGKTYTGWGSVTLPVKALIEKVMGPISIRVSYIRKGSKDTPLTHYIHADRAVAKYAFVLCLEAPDCKTGTAFWTHKESGMTELPFPTSPEMFEMLDGEIEDETKWEQTEFVESKENRAVIFDAAIFHSRWPKVIESDSSRIVCTVFFDLNSDIEKWAEAGWNTDRREYSHSVNHKEHGDSLELLNWGNCDDVYQVHEGNKVCLTHGITFYLDHNDSTADIEAVSLEHQAEAWKFIKSFGYGERHG